MSDGEVDNTGGIDANFSSLPHDPKLQVHFPVTTSVPILSRLFLTHAKLTVHCRLTFQFRSLRLNSQHCFPRSKLTQAGLDQHSPKKAQKTF